MYLHTEQQSAAGKQTGCTHIELDAPLMVAYKLLPLLSLHPPTHFLPYQKRSSKMSLLMRECAVQSTVDLIL